MNDAFHGGSRWWRSLGVAWLLWMAAFPARSVIMVQERVPSAILGTNRLVRIWVPFGYTLDSAMRYPVLYLNDGQNMFSIVGTNAARGWGSWNIDLLTDELISSNRIRPILLVSVDASPARSLEYRGPSQTNRTEGAGTDRRTPVAPGDDRWYLAYQQFLVEELKPRIDKRFRTLTNAASTGILGSSLGGLCSVAVALDRPDVFGMAACLSGTFQSEREEWLERLRRRTSLPSGLRIYLDSGVVDATGGDDNRVRTDTIVAEFRRLGWRDGRDFIRFTDYTPLTHRALLQYGVGTEKAEEGKRSQHNEFYWRRRVWRALEYLFPPVQPPAAAAAAVGK